MIGLWRFPWCFVTCLSIEGATGSGEVIEALPMSELFLKIDAMLARAELAELLLLLAM